MSVTKRIVCLANSRKLSGRCVAGKEVDSEAAGQWVRPVSSRSTEEVSEHERQYRDGSDPRVLDVLDVVLVEPRAKTYQPENWLLDENQYWINRDRLSWEDLAELADTPPILWSNSSHTFHGHADRVLEADAEGVPSSLYLIHVTDLVLRVFAPSADFGNPKLRVQAGFHYNDWEYRLWVTDPMFERDYQKKGEGVYPLGEAYVTVSLGEPNKDGYHYKLVAAVITPARAGNS